jgi:hypothetical protein
MKVFKHYTVCLVVVAGVLALAGGCGDGFGESVSVPRQRQTAIDAGFRPGKPLVVPREAAFNVADAQRHSTGSGRSESFATEEGTAGCTAAVADTGEAWAEFQLGHVVHNNGAEPIEAAVLFDCEYDYRVSGPTPVSLNAGMVALKLYIQDSNKLMLRKEMLIDQEGEQGADQRSGRDSPSFNITMQPGLAYHLVLAGRVEVAAGEDLLPLEARIDVKKLTIEMQVP